MCNAGAVISTWAQQDWEAFAVTLADGNTTESRAALQRFLLGVAYRMEELQAHEMAELLEATGLANEARAELLDDVEFSLGLLAAYGRLIGDDGAEDDSEEGPNESMLGPGDLVI